MQKSRYLLLIGLIVMTAQFAGCTVDRGDIIGSEQSEEQSEEQDGSETLEPAFVDIRRTMPISLNVSDMDYKAENLEMSKYVLDYGDRATSTTFCFAEGKIYYTLYYGYYYESFLHEGKEVSFNPEDNTCIMVYDIETKETAMLYQYQEERWVHTTDMQCNGRYLVWEDYRVEEGWSIKCLDLTDLGEPEIVAKENVGNGQLDTVTLKITERYLYWYDREVDENGELGRCCIYRYDFENSQLEIVKNFIDTASPYVHISIIDGYLTTYRYYDEKESLIYIEKENEEIKKIAVNDYVKDVQSNGSICAWEIRDNRSTLYVYDIINEKYLSINCKDIFSFALYKNLLVVNQENGLYVYNVRENTYYVLRGEDSKQCNYTYKGIDGVYAEVYTNSYIFIK